MIQPLVIYVLWLREMIKFCRVKSRVLGMIIMPSFMLVFLGLGFRRVDIPGLPDSITYIQYLVPGIVGMTLLFSGSFVGISVLMDRQFGFLKEIMVTPASRASIVLGRIAGGATTSIIQGLMMLLLALFLGFSIPGILQFFGALVTMVFISIIFICVGLILSSRMKDIHGFNTILNFFVFPVFLSSGALFPIDNLPIFIRYFSYLNPLTYGVDALRGFLIGFSNFPLYFDSILLIIFSLVMIGISSWSFQKGDL